MSRRSTLALASSLLLSVVLAPFARDRAGQGDGAGPTLAPEIVTRLDAADRAFLLGDAAAAQAAYGQVLARSRDCRPALWGRAVSLLRLGRDYQALPLLERAVGEAPTTSACNAAARALLAGAPSPDRRAAARRYSERAVAAEPGPGPDARAEALFRLALETDHIDAAIAAWRGLVAARPEIYAETVPAEPMASPRPPGAGPATFPAGAGILGGDWGRVLPGLAACLAIGVAWALGLGLLFGVGDLHSRATLRLVERVGGGAGLPPRHGLLRRSYGAVILASALYYYVSLGVILLLVTAVPAGVLYGLATTPRVPGSLVPLAVPLALAWAAVVVPLALSSRLRWVESAEGRPLAEAHAPGLWRLAREVAQAVGTRPVDEIRLVVDARIGVAERGRPSDLRRDRSIRCLQLGMANFDGFSLDAFRAVLAHEYAHILHRDTARPALASQLEARLGRSLAWTSFWGGDARWNLVWCFNVTYARFFRRINRGAGCLAEIHADRVAVLAYGASASAMGLRHCIRRHVEYQESLGLAVREALGISSVGPPMLLRNSRALRRRALAERSRTEMSAPAHGDQSHPPPDRRLEMFEAIGREQAAPDGEAFADGADDGPDGDGLWSLFAEPSLARAEARRRFEAQVQVELDAQASLGTQIVAPLTAAIHDDPGSAVPYRRRSEAYYNLGDWHAAIRDLDSVLDRDPADAGSWLARGKLRMFTGDLDGAEVDLREASRLGLADTRAPSHAALGDLAVASGNLEQAVEEFGRSLVLDPAQPDTLLKRGEARRRLGCHRQAEPDFAETARLDPGSIEARLGLALVYEALGRRDRAIAVAEEALALDDGLPDTHIRLAALLLGPPGGPSPDPARALVHARKAVTLAGGPGADPEADALAARAATLVDAASNIDLT